jgi:hypothetical protein
MLLIREEIDNIQVLSEMTESGKKKLYITGPFLEAEVVNGNKRKYPIEVLQNGVNVYKKDYIDTGRAVGTLNHEDSPSISLDRVSHKILSLEQDGNVYVGKAVVLDTPCGNILRGLLEGEVKIGVSSRALGSLQPTNEGYSIVKNDFSILAIDAVSRPSAPSAWINGILEGKEYIYDAARGSYIEKEVEQLYESLPKYSKQKIEETALQLFNWYLNGISTAKI